jgi:DNA-binding transcriptional MerR regulator
MGHVCNKNYFSINEISILTQTSVGALLYYDMIGLLGPRVSSLRGYPVYTQDDLARLEEVKFLRDLGFGLPQIKSFLQLDRDRRTDTLDNLRVQTKRLLIDPASAKELLPANDDNAVQDLVSKLWWPELDLPQSVQIQLVRCQENFGKTFSLDKAGYDKLWVGVLAEKETGLALDPFEDLSREMCGRGTALLQMFYGANKDLCHFVQNAALLRYSLQIRTGMTADLLLWGMRVTKAHGLYPQ